MESERKRTRPAPQVLVVEDDDGQAVLTMRTLRKHGFEVRREETGRGCLDILQAGGDFLVLLDLGLPDMHGLDVLQKIVARSNEIPVIVVTGVDDLKIAVEAIQKGAWDYIVKRVDLSHVKELPHVIRRNRDRQKLVHERNLFVSMLSHDIKNPVQVILSYAEIIQEDADLSEESRTFLDRVKHNAESILRLVGDFVEVRKIEAGKLSLDRQPTELGVVLRAVVDQQATLGNTRDVAVGLELPASLPEVPADRHYLERAVTNLVGNGVKYTPAGGRVRVSARADGQTITIAVADTGRGIPEDELPFVFDKYRRARGHGAAEGSGLGLFIVRSIVEAHGGSVGVTSEVDRGSTFTITLPLTSTGSGELGLSA